MSRVVRSLAIAACGLVTSVITAVVFAIASKALDMDLYTLSAWGLLPVGAIAAGGLAASGSLSTKLCNQFIAAHSMAHALRQT
jgi:hypothetical protein